MLLAVASGLSAIVYPRLTSGVGSWSSGSRTSLASFCR